MKNLRLVAVLCLSLILLPLGAQRLVILHTNDTHSHLDADSGRGGVLQRKALIDSVRAAERNVLLIDAGDVVQGTLYFKLFGGKVEFPLMDLMGYDYQIVGNHEFDNGLPALARYYKKEGAVKLATNYDFTSTPLAGVFQPWDIREIEGKKVGFFALNLDPAGIIGEQNVAGVAFTPIIDAAQATARLLRQKGCDYVVAISHIGFTDDTGTGAVTDPMLAAATSGIDLIVGGHSHTEVGPGTAEPGLVTNAAGEPVQIVQTGRYGNKLGYVAVDLNKGNVLQARLIPVQSVDTARFDPAINAWLAPWRERVDSINSRRIATVAFDMPNGKKYVTSAAISNLAADIALDYACAKMDSLRSLRPDLAIINCGGIRLPFPQGDVTQGQILSAFPFSNRITVVEMDGESLLSLLRQAMAQEGQAPSRGVLMFSASGFALLDRRPIDPAGTYRVATLDYLAEGGDYLSEFKKGRRVWTDTVDFCVPVMD